MTTIEEARELLNANLTQPNLIKHSLASEAVMRAVARKLGEDEEQWGMAALLHDLDFEETKETPEKHGIKTAEMLEGKLPDESIHAIKAHNAEHTGVERTSKFDHALTCCEQITGLVVATALVYPDKKIASVKPSSVLKRMKKKDFARQVDRERIRDCEHIDLTLEEFVEIAVEAMKEIGDELGL